MPRAGASNGPRMRPLTTSVRAVVMVMVMAVAMAGVTTLITAAPAGSSASTDRPARHVRSPRIIIDTDLSLWWDDATAIGMANVLEQRGELRVLGMVSDIRNPVAVAAIDAINTAYGHSRIPLGAV